MNILKTVTVDSVLQAFTKSIDQLYAVADNNEQNAEKLREKISEAHKKEQDARHEANRARSVARKLTSIIE